MADIFTDDDDALLSELGIEVEKKQQVTRTPREERIIAGFEDIQKFVAEHGRLPQSSEDGDIFERLYAVRLQRLRELPEAADLLADLDDDGLLSGAKVTPVADDLDDDALLAALGVEVEASPIIELRHVRSNAERKEAEDIANRHPRQARRVHGFGELGMAGAVADNAIRHDSVQVRDDLGQPRSGRHGCLAHDGQFAPLLHLAISLGHAIGRAAISEGRGCREGAEGFQPPGIGPLERRRRYGPGSAEVNHGRAALADEGRPQRRHVPGRALLLQFGALFAGLGRRHMRAGDALKAKL